jgi:3,4-dihydroxyphenylacetate 2,3-dioxygenase
LLVAGLFSTHVPRLMIFDPDARRAYMGKNVSTFYNALEHIRRERIAPLDFETFVVIDTHWHTTLDFVVNAHERLRGTYTSDEIPDMLHEYEYDYPGDPQLAAAVVEEGRSGGVPVVASAHRGLPVHYGTLNPMHYYNPGPEKKRVLSISVCDTAEVEPNLALGEAIARAVRRTGRRTILIASGGMSHRFWPLAVIRQRASADPTDISTPKARKWDEKIMGWWRTGDHASVLAAADEFRRECAPEGRFAHYLVLAGAFGRNAFRTPGEQFGRYEAAIGTGQANFWFAGEST